MVQDNQITEVRFYLEPDGNVFAAFPSLSYGVNESDGVMCYSHIGQHSGCSISYLSSSKLKPANMDEYSSLLEELISIGYVLRVLNKN